jgi:hypothetical protein
MTESKIQFSGELQQNQMAHTLLLLHSSACSFRRILPSYSTKAGFVAFVNKSTTTTCPNLFIPSIQEEQQGVHRERCIQKKQGLVIYCL